MMATRVSREPAYLLHSRHYRESSLLVDILTLNYGFVRLVVKGALRPKSSLKGLLQPFQPLLISWQGRSDLKTLTDVEISSRLSTFRGDYLYSGLYLNEILSKLLQPFDPYPQIFSAYADVMGGMNTSHELEPMLRRFEYQMLNELGAFPSFSVDASTGLDIDCATYYVWKPELGFVSAIESQVMPGNFSANRHIILGEHLIELSQADFTSKETLLAAKRLSRLMIDHLLDGRVLKSRELIAKTRELKKYGPA